METRLADWIQDTPDGATADRILRACVHCGFCLATCPTYQVLGDELDSPRGRIYQIKQVLEGAQPTRETQLHLDRCLTCSSCETTCPSGVEYRHLLDIGRAAVHERVERPWRERAARWVLREGLTRRWLFATALGLARAVSWTLPAGLRSKVGVARPVGRIPAANHDRAVLLLNGCVQPAMQPSIDAATARVLDAIGVKTVVAAKSGCCGGIRLHADDEAGALDNARRNIDAWWPSIEANTVEAILVNASGCGVIVRDYGHLLRTDPAYADKARRVSELAHDPVEFLASSLPALTALAAKGAGSTPRSPGVSLSPHRRVAFQAPCTLQHRLKIRGEVERILTALGAEVLPVGEPHLCCGSSGTYSLLQRDLSTTLRDRKLENLVRRSPDVILSANIGCIGHLQTGTQTPVLHWIEWVDQAIAPGASR
ncbi:MAG TPA: glycolate oxidase subunit GlcF [Steroidobacteraceae bacterium]